MTNKELAQVVASGSIFKEPSLSMSTRLKRKLIYVINNYGYTIGTVIGLGGLAYITIVFICHEKHI